MKLKPAFFLTLLFLVINGFSQENKYIYWNEGLGPNYPFSFFFENGNGYLEIIENSITGILTDPDNVVPYPGEEEINYSILLGQYQLRFERDFRIIMFDNREFIFLQSADEAISLLIPLEEDSTTSGGIDTGGRWLQFWGIQQILFNQDLIITSGASLINYSSALVETLNNNRLTYSRLAGKFVMTRSSRWVEGSAGDGIGEYIIVNPSHSDEGMIFHNGFIAPWNLNLFYENSRVKRIRIEYNDVVEYFDIEDTPNPQIIPFRKPATTPIKITIMDIYPGSRYNHTAISNILFFMRLGIITLSDEFDKVIAPKNDFNNETLNHSDINDDLAIFNIEDNNISDNNLQKKVVIGIAILLSLLLLSITIFTLSKR